MEERRRREGRAAWDPTGGARLRQLPEDGRGPLRVFLIADLCGYTALTETHGDLRAVEIVERYRALALAALRGDARLVERVGDELLIAASDAPAAVATALQLLDAVEREPDFPTVRAGLHAGRVVEHEGRYVGAALNLAARVAAHARGGQVLCTQPVAEAARGLSGVEHRALGSVRFRNVYEPVDLFELVRAGEGRDEASIDPVCRMQVRPETAPARLPFAGRTFHFCSLACARAFAEAPERYAGD